ncbi:1,2-dihydroxy-3-keto-5-methylthiopentene dioxygenase [Pseudomonas sp. NFACC15-1]|uniref:1,2-dihydroxy-3-keto-5-methylthiopentene dioxygenase n=1 Tax=unclassified Pseudomonas TaxID=196821 RepID=UPI00088E2B48|nr:MULTISPECIES: acireductone dioxygenase [unclassified Pseudomonas]SDA70458.1 1,2-dihydroxy-3-keto-5-methylthiopentene dioxygenase [Pseudomonas sp. NFACC15-1]SDB64563.1 1,2-dihydroxy-3-keto-5-methylthiopentene dioxygenase [Pseudomonas sp. NFACC13-1]SDY15008.1 1,2-dihydroxy-3-keto-5-methylthiopentene dioxygenase [Pseudomonas sp. NFACC14]
MSSLSVYHVSSPDLPNKVLTHFEDIAATLAEQGVRFDRWEAAAKIQPGASEEDIIAAYQAQIDALMTERGYVAVDVVSVSSDHTEQVEPQAEWLDEYRHGQDEVRFFVSGRGLFNLHIGDYVYAVLCERNDLITVPAGTPHWFDRGERPHFVSIRLSGDAQGVVAEFTGDDIARRFPRLED